MPNKLIESFGFDIYLSSFFTLAICKLKVCKFFPGRSLVRLNENSLLRLGIVHPDHRQSILRAVAKLRLRYNIVALRDIERK